MGETGGRRQALSGDELRVASLAAGRAPASFFTTPLASGDRGVADRVARRALVARGLAEFHDEQIHIAPGANRWLAPLLRGNRLIEMALGTRRHMVAGSHQSCLVLSEVQPDVWSAATASSNAASVAARLLDDPSGKFPLTGAVRATALDPACPSDPDEVTWTTDAVGIHLGPRGERSAEEDEVRQAVVALLERAA